MADRVSWLPIEKYEADPWCEGEEDDKKWKQAVRKAKEEKEKRRPRRDRGSGYGYGGRDGYGREGRKPYQDSYGRSGGYGGRSD